MSQYDSAGRNTEDKGLVWKQSGNLTSHTGDEVPFLLITL